MIPFGWHVWKGETGKHYRFRIALFRHQIPNDSGGIYLFVRRRFFFFLFPIYVGKAANLRERLWSHEKWSRAYWDCGVTERHFRRVHTEEERQIIEEDLIRSLNPALNTQLKTHGINDAPIHEPLRRRWARRRQHAA